MSKKLVHDLTYDAPVEAVSAMLADPAFREEVCHSIGVTQVDVTIEDEGGTTVVVIDQMQPTAGVPSFAKKFVGDVTNVVQSERWSTPTHGEITVAIPGKPGEMRGTAVLSDRDGGTVEHVEMTVKVSIPLIGGKLEDLISGLLLRALKAENVAGRAYLAR
jgi:hypothetical protein